MVMKTIVRRVLPDLSHERVSPDSSYLAGLIPSRSGFPPIAIERNRDQKSETIRYEIASKQEIYESLFS